MSSQRVYQRASQQSFRFSPQFRSQFRQAFQRRWQSTASEPTVEAPKGAFAKFWSSPVGPKTVHFWAPVMKWALVITGASDFARPAESLSLTQQIALVATGAIWTRWCLIIKPKNVLLAAVNFFLFIVAGIQVTRIFLYQKSLKNTTTGEEAKDLAKGELKVAEGIVKDPKGAAKEATAAN